MAIGRVEFAVARPLLGLRVMRFASGTHRFRAIPERYTTALQLTGRTEWTMRDARWWSSPGTITIKIPGEVYAERARRGPSHFQVVVFDDALVAGARASAGQPAALPAIDALPPRDPRARALDRLHRALLDAHAEPLALETLTTEAVAEFVALASVPRSPPARRTSWGRAVARARALLDDRLTDVVPLDELAAHARLDKYHLCRAFRAEVGLPPHAYVTHRRVSRAQELLARGMPQAEVAARVGLYDQSQLHRHFKRIVGLTPGAFARAVR